MGTGAANSINFSQRSFDFLADMCFDSLILNSFDLDSSEGADIVNNVLLIL